ncbi:MAG: DUF1080 domain-containing protein [Verrucomicrobia bacterium]|nr:DUF1080 domain-containing protein [Verrucomicrobiota bacterium]
MKTGGTLRLFTQLPVIALLTSALPTLAVDAVLQITRSEDKLIISWPQDTANQFYLQSTASLSPPVLWSNVTNEVVTVGSDFVITNDATELASFYRLQAWEVLFDGTNTSAFRTYRGTTFPSNNWMVISNELRTVPTNSANWISIITTNTYSDFELQLEWNATVAGNSGVFYRVSEAPDGPEKSGPENQIVDDATHPNGTNPVTSASSVFGVIAPTNKVLNPAGQFNTVRIVILTNHVEQWLNGNRVVEYNLNSQEFMSMVSTSRYSGDSLYGKVTNGGIVLQHHNASVAYRNVRIRRLGP